MSNRKGSIIQKKGGEGLIIILQEFGQVDGVISFWELSQPLVARLAEQLSLPGNPPDAVDNARDKQVQPDSKIVKLLHTSSHACSNSVYGKSIEHQDNSNLYFVSPTR